MNLQLTSTSSSSLVVSSIRPSISRVSDSVIGVIENSRTGGSAVQGGGGYYYSFIGGGAAPFGPVLNMESLENGALLKSCVRHIHITNRKKRKMTQTVGRGMDGGQMGQLPHGFEGSTFSQDGSTRTGKLYCRSGHHLQIHDDGKVNGTRQENNRFGVLEFLSVAFGLVSIKGKESNRYLCMNRRGRLYGSTRLSGECIFMEKMLENYYNTYTSCRYGRGRHSKKKWYVALNKRGRPKRGNQSRKKHKFTQFLVLHLDADDYKWTKRKFVFTNRDAYFGLNSFTQDWRRKQPPWEHVKSVRSQPAMTSSNANAPSDDSIPSKNPRTVQHRLRQSRSAQ